MRGFAIVVLVLLAGACATPAPEADAPVVSWGKAGVPLETYWLDAAECTLRAAQADTNLPVATHSLNRQGGPIGDQDRDVAGDESIVSLNDTILRARQNEMMQLRADEAARQVVVDACLTERGYRRFALTPQQAARLETLASGSTPRRRYLHSLASDPAVLSAQSL